MGVDADGHERGTAGQVEGGGRVRAGLGAAEAGVPQGKPGQEARGPQVASARQPGSQRHPAAWLCQQGSKAAGWWVVLSLCAAAAQALPQGAHARCHAESGHHNTMRLRSSACTLAAGGCRRVRPPKSSPCCLCAPGTVYCSTSWPAGHTLSLSVVLCTLLPDSTSHQLPCCLHPTRGPGHCKVARWADTTTITMELLFCLVIISPWVAGAAGYAALAVRAGCSHMGSFFI